ncbi:hypothetical protein TNIN_179381 [Trichonephila inaurata madagascariensis]|uniref:Uncharacterized protein n=1 Tax=Trichonephila inaurata madagascariensis TaxID=2747483 RepID=A0A8X6Y8Q3_9ARAC|nr:hypothetical protein TNIN_179381 [Trichonephila inaurata madagascariensis]
MSPCAIQSTIVGETLVFVEKDASITLQNFVRYEKYQTFMLPICNLKREEVDRMLTMELTIEESIGECYLKRVFPHGIEIGQIFRLV